MKTIDIQTTVGELVRAVPARSRIFEKLGVDYCCGGKETLETVCRERELDPETVIRLLEAMDALPAKAEANPDQMTSAALCDHVEKAHHGYLLQELPRIVQLAHKVASVHGEDEARLVRLRDAIDAFSAELIAHIREEEEVLFPMIRIWEENGNESVESKLRLQKAISKLEDEHASAGGALALFRELTDEYRAPEWACNTFRAYYEALRTLEINMHEHVHKENNILFPRVTAA